METRSIEENGGGRAKVLAVEPDPDVARRIEATLERTADVRLTGSLREARDLLDGEEWDLVLLEIDFPDGSGLDLLPARTPEEEESPVPGPTWLALGKEDDGPTAAKALDSGADDYLVMSEASWRILPALVARARKMRRLAKELRRSAEFGRNLVAEAPDAIFVASPEGRYLDVNRAGCELIGYTREEILARSIGDFVLTDEASDVRVGIERLRRGESVLMTRRLRRKDGSVVDAELSTWGLPDGRMMAFIRDITARVRAEQELRESEERYRLLVEGAPLPIVVHRDGKIVFLNSAAIRMLGGEDADADEFIGKCVLDFVHPDIRETVRARLDRGDRNRGSTEMIRERFMRLDGDPIDVEFVTTPVVYHGDPAAQTILLDVTMQVRQEAERERLRSQLRQAQRLETIGTLAGGIAHDFNNIIQAIMGFAEMARADVEPDSRTYRDLDHILLGARRAKHLVEQILTFSRLDDRDRCILDLRSIVRESLELLRATLPRTIEIRQNLCQEPCLISADPTQVQQVIMNLGANSYQAMRETGGTFEVALDGPTGDDDHGAGADKGDPLIRVRVRDDGPGMAPEVTARIFEPFFTTKDVGEGTGLGLSVVHGIVASHGGVISVVSEPGVGTEFEILWPCATAAEAADSDEADATIPTGKGRILVVDDERAIVTMVKRILERVGYEVVETTGSREALEAFRSHPDLFDLVLTDQTMPFMIGTELIEEIRRIRPGIPAILMTGYSETVGPKRAAELGIGEFLMKPVTSGELGRAVHRALSATVRARASR